MGSDKPTKEHVNEVMNDAIAKSTPEATAASVAQQFQRTDNMHYMKIDSIIANPGVMLGSVFYEKAGRADLQQFYISVDGKIDETTVLKTPLVRTEMIVNNKIAANADILAYVTFKLENNEVFEFRVVDNYVAHLSIKGKDWINAVNEWNEQPAVKKLLDDKKVGAVGIVVGIVQKFISTKKYKKFDGSAKGGAFGVNVGGELYLSSTDYSLDIVYGLNLLYLPQVETSAEVPKLLKQNLYLTDLKKIELNTRLPIALKKADIAKFARLK